MSPEQRPRELKQKDFDRLVELLVGKAVAHRGGVNDYFRLLVTGADLPPAFKEQGAQWSMSPRSNAVDLVNWAQNKGTNPRNPSFTTLGSILITQFADSGLEQAATLASLIIVYELCHDPQQLADLAMRYQIPRRPAGGADHGPEIDWRGPTDIELQGWFRPDPNLLDVGFLQCAIERARSVCRVEVGITNVTGTGVMIDSDLALTNFHVLGKSMTDLEKAAGTTRLRFGAFTTKGGDEKVGQVVALDAAKPIVASSPENAHDFVVLRADRRIGELTDIRPAPFSLSKPAARSGVNILQHPGGKAMMLAISSSGITGAYPDVGYLQYVSRTAPGSSGGPCFDDDWNMVAVHHAVRSRAFGVIGEGILMSSIHETIKEIMKAQPV
jgi:hypothetical protein